MPARVTRSEPATGAAAMAVRAGVDTAAAMLEVAWRPKVRIALLAAACFAALC